MIAILPLALFCATLVAVVFLLRRGTGADRALLKQNRDLHDLITTMTGEDRGWLAHQREMARLQQEGQARHVQMQWEQRAPSGAANLMEVEPVPEKPTDIPMPPHGEPEI